MIEFFYNNNVHITTLIISFFIITEKHLRMKFCVKSHSKKSKSITNYTMRMKRLHENLYYRLAETNFDYATQHDKRHFAKMYFINQLIRLNVKNICIKKSFKKLEVKKYELYRILKRLSKQVYRLKLSLKMCIHSVFNVNLLKSFCSRKKIKWVVDEESETKEKDTW